MATRKATPVSRTNSDHGVIRAAVGAAEALSVGVVHLTRTTLVEAVRAAHDVGSELGTAAVRTMRGSVSAAREIGGDLKMVGQGISRGLWSPSKPPVKSPARAAVRSASRKQQGSARTP